MGEVQGMQGVAKLKKFLAMTKGMVYHSCVRSGMFYGSEIWCLRENEMSTLRRTERAVVRAICGAKLIEKKRTEDLMEMLRLKETVVQMAKVNGTGHVLRGDDGHVLRKNIGVGSEGQEEVRMTKEDMEDASGEGEQECWFGEGDGEWELERLLLGWGKSGHSPIYGDKPGSKLDDDDDQYTSIGMYLFFSNLDALIVFFFNFSFVSINNHLDQ